MVLKTTFSAFSSAQIFIPILSFLFIRERISLLYQSYQKNLALLPHSLDMFVFCNYPFEFPYVFTLLDKWVIGI